MSAFYHVIYMGSGINFNPKAKGLKGLLVEIGRIEYRKKEKRACRENRAEFIFPSEKRNHKYDYYQVTGMTSDMTSRGFGDVSEDDFYKEGVYRINKNAKMGEHNKRAIYRLVDSENGRGNYGSHKVFNIHKYKTSRIYAAIYRYFENAAKEKYAGIDVGDWEINEYFRNELEKVAQENFMPNLSGYTGSEIITRPYTEHLRDSTEFSGNQKIVWQMDIYDVLTRNNPIRVN